MFELKVKDKIIPLYWGTWAMHQFTKQKGTVSENGVITPLALDQYFQLLSNPTIDLSNTISFLFIGYQSACMKNKTPIEYSEFDVYEWLDELGGLLDTNGPVMEYMKYIVSETVVLLSKKEQIKEGVKKKG